MLFRSQGDTVEIDHRRDLFWAEAALRERDEADLDRRMRKAS